MSSMSFAEARNDFYVGPAHHPYRTLFWVLSALGLAAALLGYLAYERNTAAASISRLSRFEALYMNRCDAESFDSSDEIVALRRKLYLGSPILEHTITTQLAALENGATCESVTHALRGVDFPMRTVAP
jgi:hypothetical protein